MRQHCVRQHHCNSKHSNPRADVADSGQKKMYFGKWSWQGIWSTAQYAVIAQLRNSSSYLLAESWASAKHTKPSKKITVLFPPLLAANQCNGSTISLNATVKHNLRPPHRLPLAALESTSRAHAGWCCIMSQAVAGCHRSQFDLSTGHFLPSWPRGPPTEGAVWRKVLMQDLMIAGKQWFWRRLLSVVETKWFKWRLLLQQCALHHIPTTVRVGGLNHAGFNLYKWL